MMVHELAALLLGEELSAWELLLMALETVLDLAMLSAHW
jgi:hypothetical protein